MSRQATWCHASQLVDRNIEAGPRRTSRRSSRRRDAHLRAAAPRGQPRRPPAARARRAPRGPRPARARRHDGVPVCSSARCGSAPSRSRSARSTRPTTTPTTPRTPTRRFAITDANLVPRLREALAGMELRLVARGGDGPDVLELDGGARRAGRRARPGADHRDDMAFWLYSSGSTGKPKGVVHLQHDIEITCEYFAGEVLGIREDDVMFSTTKLFHAYGLGNGLSFPLWFGATSVLMRGPTRPERILATLRDHRPTVFFSVPALYGALVRDPGGRRRARLGAHVRVGRRGAPAADRSTAGRSASGSRSSTASARRRCCTSSARTGPGTVAPGTTGRPVPGYELRLVDEDGHVLEGPAVGGARGPRRLLRGLLLAPAREVQALHARRLVRHRRPLRAARGRRLRRTWAAMDDMLKVGGLWVSPVDMENVLLAHPRVLGVGVVGVTIEDQSRSPRSSSARGRARRRGARRGAARHGARSACAATSTRTWSRSSTSCRAR